MTIEPFVPDEAELAAMAFLARYSGPTLDAYPATEEGAACMVSQAGPVIRPLGAKPVPLGAASQSVSPRLGGPTRLSRSDGSGH
jgi:hypothetical protein